MREAVGSATRTADLFAGLGTFGLALPGQVYAAEASRDAVLALKAAVRGDRRLWIAAGAPLSEAVLAAAGAAHAPTRRLAAQGPAPRRSPSGLCGQSLGGILMPIAA